MACWRFGDAVAGEGQYETIKVRYAKIWFYLKLRSLLTVYNLLLVNLPLVIGMIIFLTRQQLAALIEANFGLHVDTLVFTGIAIGFYILWMVLYFPLRYKQYQEMVAKRKK